ncbi:MAG: hypothetical protein J5I65_14950 [Aridibacter famidurans]|nr:hypothetical protein [Aridibacter famidurans]
MAHYGPNDKLATKIAIGFASSENEDPEIVERLFSKDDSTDIRTDDTLKRIAEIAKELGTKSVLTVDRIIGCPHEEGTDYPEGEACPQCPFWANRDRWTGDLVH